MPDVDRNEEFWRDYLTHPDTLMATGRRFFSRLPANPRCRLCSAPFAGGGGMAMRMIGKRQSSANPNYCNSCEKVLIKHHGGAEIDASFLFADIRGSTAPRGEDDANGVSVGARSLLHDRVERRIRA